MLTLKSLLNKYHLHAKTNFIYNTGLDTFFYI